MINKKSIRSIFLITIGFLAIFSLSSFYFGYLGGYCTGNSGFSFEDPFGFKEFAVEQTFLPLICLHAPLPIFYSVTILLVLTTILYIILSIIKITPISERIKIIASAALFIILTILIFIQIVFMLNNYFKRMPTKEQLFYHKVNKEVVDLCDKKYPTWRESASGEIDNPEYFNCYKSTIDERLRTFSPEEKKKMTELWKNGGIDTRIWMLYRN